ncbi:MAG: type II toxin-antitoxin system YafQ family toxin [Clostridiales bacterium]|nr:type II toxin-antitoxin system YafQ family toxin [Clostridiales bacterium]
MPYIIKPSNQFKRDLKKAHRQGRVLHKLYFVIDSLAAGEPLPERFYNHSLIGNYKGCSECHIEPDWLLIYEFVEPEHALILDRLGSHSELFG